MRRLSAAATLAALALAASAHAGTIYQNDFSANANGFTGGALVTAPLGETFLGNLAQGASAVLTLNTAGFSSITLDFDLYGVLSLDGNTPGREDYFRLAVVGGPELLNDSFSNFTFETQGYGPGASDTGRTGSDAGLYGHLGYFWRPDVYFPDGGDSTYHFSFTFAPTGASTQIAFFGDTNDGIDDESFGIDNVHVTGVPEPASWGLMIVGFGAAGALLRRKRVSAAFA